MANGQAADEQDPLTIPAQVRLTPDMVQGILAGVAQYNGQQVDSITYLDADGQELQVGTVVLAIRLPGWDVKDVREDDEFAGLSPMSRMLAEVRRSYMAPFILEQQQNAGNP